MPDLSVARQDIMARSEVKLSNGHQDAKSIFQHDKQKMTMGNAFFQAVIKGNVNKVRHQLNRGHNINTKNDYGMHPLVAALHIEEDSKRSRVFLLLLEKGATHKARDERHDRPVLHWACILGQEEQVKTLLEETAGDINLSDKDNEGLTALHHAVKVGNLPIVQHLVDYHVRFGVSVDIPDKLGLTPYIHARRLGYRDVAGVLREQGMASVGHGDHLFRSPREWSQIGKFERKKAIELNITDQVNAAKIMGKLGLARIVGNSPRMAVPGIVVPSYVPDNKAKPSPGLGKRIHHISVSLPSLGDALLEEGTEFRPASTENKGIVGGETESTTGSIGAKPGPPRVAFEIESNKSSVNSYSTNNRSLASHKPSVMSGPRSTLMSKTSNHQAFSVGGDYNENLKGLTNPLRPLPPASIGSQSAPYRSNFAPPGRTNSNLAAFSLLEQTSFSRGRLASSAFVQSQFDETKASEYKHMMGNLNSIMDVLSQQQTRSFRKSVEVKKPVTPPKVKKKNKVSTLAIIFGQNKRSAKKKGSKSPRSKSPRSSRSPRQKGVDGKGKSKSSGGSDSKKKDKSHQNQSESKQGKMNKLPVPTIRIN